MSESKMATLYVRYDRENIVEVTNGKKIFMRLTADGTLYISGVNVKIVDEIPVNEDMDLDTVVWSSGQEQDGRS